MESEAISRRLAAASKATFALAVTGIGATFLMAFAWLFSRHSSMCGSDGCWFPGASPAGVHHKLLLTLAIGGATILVFALAVILGGLALRREGLSLAPLRAHLAIAAVTGLAAVALALVPATFHWCAVPGVVCAVSLVRCHFWIARSARATRVRSQQ